MTSSRAGGSARQALTVAGVLVGVLLGGCGSGDSSDGRAVDPSPTAQVDEVAAHGGKVCPARLPLPEAPGHGFGTSEPAASAPSLPSADAAWVCVYEPAEAGPGPDGDGTSYGWEREGAAHSVPPADLDPLLSALDDLSPADPERMCTADMGPRLMLVLEVAGDLTGVVVDEFGCREVRLTDEPFETPPGEATAPGTVSGVLTGPAGLLELMRAVGTRP